MTLHISEIGIRMAIGEAVGSGSAPGSNTPSPGGLTDAQHEALVRECVRNVLATLHLRERR